MSCYFRHIKTILKEAGIEITPDNKKEIDRMIHEIVGIPYKNCSDTWKKAKESLASDEAKNKFMASLRQNRGSKRLKNS